MKLYEKMLEAPFIINGFVLGEPKCNYERYLTELINHSALFMRKSNGKKFQWVERQDHGECDAVSDSYSIDFKRFATRSSLNAVSVTSHTITKAIDGGYVFGGARLPAGDKFTYYRTSATLRRYTVEDFQRIAETQTEDIEKQISIILKNLRTKKNLLLFYPFIMLFSEPHSFEEGCTCISEAFNDDLHEILVYRRKEVPDSDTFLCTVFEEKLLIFGDIDGYWSLEDNVELSSSKTYMDLYYTYGNGGFNF